MKMYKDESCTVPALCPLRGMAQCVSECALYIDDFPDKGDCVIRGREPIWMYVGDDDEPHEVDGRE